MFEAGLMTLLGVMLIMGKFDRKTLRKLLGYEVELDIFVSLFLTWLLSGTFSGMMAAIVGGLLFSITLFILKRTIGAERLQPVQCRTCGRTHLQWVDQKRPVTK